MDALPPATVALLDRVVRLVHDTLPDADERVYKGGVSRGYHAPRIGALFGVFPRPDAVYVSFPHGHLLPDPDGLLGPERRHVALRPDAPFPEAALARLLVAARLFREGVGPV